MASRVAKLSQPSNTSVALWRSGRGGVALESSRTTTGLDRDRRNRTAAPTAAARSAFSSSPIVRSAAKIVWRCRLLLPRPVSLIDQRPAARRQRAARYCSAGEPIPPQPIITTCASGERRPGLSPPISGSTMCRAKRSQPLGRKHQRRVNAGSGTRHGLGSAPATAALSRWRTKPWRPCHHCVAITAALGRLEQRQHHRHRRAGSRISQHRERLTGRVLGRHRDHHRREQVPGDDDGDVGGQVVRPLRRQVERAGRTPLARLEPAAEQLALAAPWTEPARTAPERLPDGGGQGGVGLGHHNG